MKKSEIIALDQRVPALTERQALAVIRRGQLTPEECAKHKRATRYHEQRYCATMQSFRGFALLRYFITCYNVCKGELSSDQPKEVVRIYYDETGRRYLFVRPCRPMPWYFDAYDYRKPLRYVPEPRPNNYRAQQRLEIDTDTVVFSVPRHLAMRGYCSRVAPDAIRTLYTQQGETMCKQGFYNVLRYATYHDISDSLLTALRICHRNHYRLPDEVRSYDDYIGALRFLGLDIHNAHYVCPQNFAEAHDLRTRQARRLNEKLEKERARRRAAEWEKAYHKRVAAFLSIVLKAKDLVITPLQSVREFIDEGEAMHHCVYDCGYYKKADCLILSARDSRGNRLATIELDTAKGRIVQCRGLCNKIPKRDEAIRGLINRNMNKFHKAA